MDKMDTEPVLSRTISAMINFDGDGTRKRAFDTRFNSGYKNSPKSNVQTVEKLPD